MKLTRRQLLYASTLGLNYRLPAATRKDSPLFEEIPSDVSKITFVHDNGMSDKRYLPETMGPGCAFLDYDNDGWMDIYLVNSGPSRFLHAEEADPQRALQEQSRRHVHRCHGEGGRRRRNVRHGRGGGRLRQRRLARSCS